MTESSAQPPPVVGRGSPSRVSQRTHSNGSDVGDVGGESPVQPPLVGRSNTSRPQRTFSNGLGFDAQDASSDSPPPPVSPVGRTNSSAGRQRSFSNSAVAVPSVRLDGLESGSPRLKSGSGSPHGDDSSPGRSSPGSRKLTRGANSPTAATRVDTHLERIVSELIQSERAYVKDLEVCWEGEKGLRTHWHTQILLQIYVDPLLAKKSGMVTPTAAGEVEPCDLLTSLEVSTVFSNIHQVLAVNRRLLALLERDHSVANATTSLLDVADLLKVYGVYCSNQVRVFIVCSLLSDRHFFLFRGLRSRCLMNCCSGQSSMPGSSTASPNSCRAVWTSSPSW
jgi:hypothetical protein